MPHLLTLNGCDDTTAILVRVTNPTTLDALEAIATVLTEEGGGCRPTMSLREIPESEVNTWDDGDAVAVVDL